jgi:ATP-dependent Clp protease ATP-binding subunit ClpA
MSLPLNALTPRSRRTLVRAAELSEKAGQAFIGTEHMMLALAQDSDGLAGHVLDRLGMRDAVRRELENVIAGHGSGGSPDDPGDEVSVWLDPASLSNHPLRLAQPRG